MNNSFLESDESLRELERKALASPDDVGVRRKLQIAKQRAGLAKPPLSGMQRSELRLNKLKKIKKDFENKRQEIGRQHLNYGRPEDPFGNDSHPLEKAAKDEHRSRILLNIAKAYHGLQTAKHRKKTPEIGLRIMRDARSPMNRRVTPETKKDLYAYEIAKNKRDSILNSPTPSKNKKKVSPPLPWSYRPNWRENTTTEQDMKIHLFFEAITKFQVLTEVVASSAKILPKKDWQGALDSRIAHLEKLHNKVKDKWSPEQTDDIKRELTKLHISKMTGRHPKTIEKKQPALQHIDKMQQKAQRTPTSRPDSEYRRNSERHFDVERRLQSRIGKGFNWPKEISGNSTYWEIPEKLRKLTPSKNPVYVTQAERKKLYSAARKEDLKPKWNKEKSDRRNAQIERMKAKEKKAPTPFSAEPKGSVFTPSSKRLGKGDYEKNVPQYTPEPKYYDEPDENDNPHLKSSPR